MWRRSGSKVVNNLIAWRKNFSSVPALSTACAWSAPIELNKFNFEYSFLNKHYYESDKRNFNQKIFAESFFGHYSCTNVGFDEYNHNTKKKKTGFIVGKSVAGNVGVQNCAEFRSQVFEILLEMCFDFSISKAHSEAEPPIIFGSPCPARCGAVVRNTRVN